MTRKRELRLATVALAHEFRFGVSGGRMRVVAALLALDVGPAVAIAKSTITVIFLRLETFQQRPQFDQGCIHRKMLVGQPATILRQPHDLRKEQVRDLVLQQPALVLRECGVIKRRLIRIQIEEPAKSRSYCSRSQNCRSERIE